MKDLLQYLLKVLTFNSVEELPPIVTMAECKVLIGISSASWNLDNWLVSSWNPELV